MQERKRRTTSITIDSLVLDKINLIAKDRDITVSRYIEEHFFCELQRIGLIPPEIEALKETRGGDRTKSSDS